MNHTDRQAVFRYQPGQKELPGFMELIASSIQLWEWECSQAIEAQSKPWALDCRRYINGLKQLMEEYIMCTANNDDLTQMTIEELRKADNLNWERHQAIEAEYIRRERLKSIPVKNRLALDGMRRLEGIKEANREGARQQAELEMGTAPVIHQEPDNLTPSERVRARARRLGFNL